MMLKYVWRYVLDSATLDEEFLLMPQDIMLPFTGDPAASRVSDGIPGQRQETVSGEVLRIVFESEDGQYTVLRLRDDDNRELTLVGALGGVLEGQDIEATGHWENHSKHGLQFRIARFRALLPTTDKGIRRYLASGLIPGIGPKLADRIVDRFGQNSLDVLDHYSARLKEIPGLGAKRIAQIRESWQEHGQQRDAYIFLQGLGISPAQAARILAHYGPGAPEVVRRNPYQLASDIHGIGFVTADRLARQLGIAQDSPLRLAAGVVYALERLADDGHVCYPHDRLLEYVADLLKVEPDQARIGIERALANGQIVRQAPADSLAPEQYYTFRLFAAETELAAALNALLSAPAPPDAESIRFDHSGFELLNDKQAAAVQAAFRSWLSIITGGPGVGKTTVTGRIVKTARRLGRRIYLAAPTGRAAKRMAESCGMSAKTIHRLLKWDAQKRQFVYGADRPLPCDFLVIDEVSMLDVELGRSLFSAVKPGTHVVLVGDRDQLPSVGPGAVLHDLIASRRIPVTNLTEIYRQEEGSKIVLNAHAVNHGDMPDLKQPPRQVAADFYWIDQDDPDRVARLIAQMAVDRIPNRFGFDPMIDLQVLAPMNRGGCGAIALNAVLQAELNPGPKPELKGRDRILRLHDRVMQVVNNYDKGVFNGELGRIVDVDPKNRTLKVMFDVGTVPYEMHETDQIKLAYAVTVHKSQGSEFPVVIMPLLTQHYVMLQRNLVYTGMTRARRLLVMVGARKALALAVRNARPSRRCTQLTERLHAAPGRT